VLPRAFGDVPNGRHPLSNLMLNCSLETLSDIFLLWDTLKSEYKVSHFVTLEEFKRFANRHFLTHEIDLIFTWLGVNPHASSSASLKSKKRRRSSPVDSCKVDMFEVLSIFAVVSRSLSDASKIRFIFALFDWNKDQAINQVEVVLMFVSVLRAIAKLSKEFTRTPTASDVEPIVGNMFLEFFAPSTKELITETEIEAHKGLVETIENGEGPELEIRHLQIWAHNCHFVQSLLNVCKERPKSKELQPSVSLPVLSVQNIQEIKRTILSPQEILLSFQLWCLFKGDTDKEFYEGRKLVEEAEGETKILVPLFKQRVADENGSFARLVARMKGGRGPPVRLRETLLTLSPGASQADLDWFLSCLESKFEKEDSTEAKELKAEIKANEILPILSENKGKYFEEFQLFDIDRDGYLGKNDVPEDVSAIVFKTNSESEKITFGQYEARRALAKRDYSAHEMESILRRRLREISRQRPNTSEPNDLTKYHADLYKEITVISDLDLYALKDIFNRVAETNVRDDGVEDEGMPAIPLEPTRSVLPCNLVGNMPAFLLDALMKRYDLDCEVGHGFADTRLNESQFLDMCLTAVPRLPPLKPNPKKMPRFFGTLSAAGIAKEWHTMNRRQWAHHKMDIIFNPEVPPRMPMN